MANHDSMDAVMMQYAVVHQNKTNRALACDMHDLAIAEGADYMQPVTNRYGLPDLSHLMWLPNVSNPA